MQCTVKTISDEVKEWTSPQGSVIKFLAGTFANGDGWSKGCKPENIDKTRAEFTALIGKEGDYELEAKSDYQGTKQWKIKSYPGRPSFSGGQGGGGKTYTVAFNNTREGCQYTTASIQAQVALKCAVELCAAGKFADDETTLSVAETFLDFLSRHTPAPAEPPKPAEMPATLAAPPAGQSDADKARVFVKGKIDAFDAVQNIDALQLLVENAKEIRARLKAKGMTELLGEIDSAICRADARFLDEVPF